MNNKKMKKGLGLVSAGLLLSMTLVVNASVENGNFDSGMTGWNDDSSFGSFAVVAGRGVLETGAGSAVPFSAVAIQGDDGSWTFSPPLTVENDVTKLFVDLSFEKIGADNGEDTRLSSFVDNLSISFLDELDPTYDLVFSSGIDFNPTVDLLTYMFNIAGVAGRTGALAFGLMTRTTDMTRVWFSTTCRLQVCPCRRRFGCSA